MVKNIGLEATVPKNTCNSVKCPFHGGLKLHGNIFTGTIISSRMHNTVTVEWSRKYKVTKYERYETRRTRIKVHNPECIAAKEGDLVRISGCRPLSKTKNFVIVENLGQVKGYKEVMEAREESKVKVKKKVEDNSQVSGKPDNKEEE